MIKLEHLEASEGYTSCTNEKILGDKELLTTLMERMMLSRKFEEKIIWLFAQGLVHGTMHPGVGEEGADVAACLALKRDDYMLATHRGHAQAIGKGCDINAMMAEILARETGLNHGRGGSMHIADPDIGVLGANGIVAGNASLVVGAGLTIKKKHIPDRVALAFMGDGASNEGVVHESMNMASVWGLPIIFCLVNNTYGMSTHISRVTKDTDLVKRAIPYAMKSFEADGNDALAAYETCCEAREYAVSHSEPVLVVLHTYRTSGHSKSDGNLYRTKEEIEMWKQRNPVERLKNVFLNKKLFTQEEIDAMDARTTKIIEDATEYAKASPQPDVAHVLDNVFSE